MVLVERRTRLDDHPRAASPAPATYRPDRPELGATLGHVSALSPASRRPSRSSSSPYHDCNRHPGPAPPRHSRYRSISTNASHRRHHPPNPATSCKGNCGRARSGRPQAAAALHQKPTSQKTRRPTNSTRRDPQYTHPKVTTLRTPFMPVSASITASGPTDRSRRLLRARQHNILLFRPLGRLHCSGGHSYSKRSWNTGTAERSERREDMPRKPLASVASPPPSLHSSKRTKNDRVETT
jgi:hypothetical protein